MSATDVVSELASKLGLADFALDENGLGRIDFDESIPVILESVDDGATLHLYSIVGAAPAEGDGAEDSFCRTLLEANLYGAGTGGAALSVNPSTGEVLLSRSLTLARVDHQDVVDELESLVNHAEMWLRRLAGNSEGAPAAAAGEAEGEPPAGMIRC